MVSKQYAIKQALESPMTLGTVIHGILLEQYGEEVYDWDPVTIYLETAADFKAEMCSEAMDRWNAIQTIMSSDAVFKRFDAFSAIANTLSDGAPFFTNFNPVTTEEAAWALAEIALNRELLPFSYTIKKFLKLQLKRDGFAEGDYPDVFEEVFEAKPNVFELRKGLAAVGNSDNINAYIKDQLDDLTTQFNRIPGLDRVDNIILKHGLGGAVDVVS